MGETKMEKTAQKGTMRLWLRIVLFVSLALNLAVLGVAIGAFARFGPHKDRPPRADQVAGVYTHALTSEDRRRIGRELMSEHRDALPSRRAMYSDYQVMVSLLRSTPFDAGAAAGILRRQLEFGQKRAELGQNLLLQRLTEMSDAERAAYADRLEQALQKRARKDVDGPGREPGGKLHHRGGDWGFMRQGD